MKPNHREMFLHYHTVLWTTNIVHTRVKKEPVPHYRSCARRNSQRATYGCIPRAGLLYTAHAARVIKYSLFHRVSTATTINGRLLVRPDRDSDLFRLPWRSVKLQLTLIFLPDRLCHSTTPSNSPQCHSGGDFAAHTQAINGRQLTVHYIKARDPFVIALQCIKLLIRSGLAV
jgi:hypothetical protein